MCDGCNQETKAYYGQAQTMGIGSSPVQMPARERLTSRLNQSYADNEKLHKALRILEAHPEFEDFIWLYQSGLV